MKAISRFRIDKTHFTSFLRPPISVSHIHFCGTSKTSRHTFVVTGENTMQILLIVAIIVVALGVIAQTGVLIAMYLMSRRISGTAEGLMNDARGPMESIISN